MDELEVPSDWLRLAQHELAVLREKMILLEHADELRILELKRGSRRWLPPRAV